MKKKCIEAARIKTFLPREPGLEMSSTYRVKWVLIKTGTRQRISQTKRSFAYTNMQDVLARFGADMSNIVDETFFVTSMDEFFGSVEDVYGAREAAYGGNPEVCQTVLQVVALVQPEQKIEIKCIAHL